MAQRRYPHPTAHEGIADNLTELAEDTTRLVHLEIDLFKQELIELVRRNAIAVGMLAGAAFALVMVLVMAQVTLVQVLEPHWLWALGFTLAWLIGAAILALVGRSRIKLAGPTASIQSLKEDLEWVKQQIKPAPR